MPNGALRIHVRTEVGKQQVVIALLEQRVDDRTEEIGIAGREKAGSNHVDRLAQLDVLPIMTAGVVGAVAQRGNLPGGASENEDVLMAHGFENLNIGAVQGSDCDGSIQRHFHVSGAGGFHARSRDLLREIRCGNNLFRLGNAVVRQHDNPQ
jgi:hypothetical protein